jgi:hypothetical protein
MLLGCVACGPSRTHRLNSGTDGAVVGVYRGRLAVHGEASRRFRLMLFAEKPDRLHAEILGPLGSPQLVVDGGGGRLSIAVVRDRIAYVGESRPDLVERALGVSLQLGQLVRAILDGELDDPDFTLARSEDPPGSLPTLLELESSTVTLRMELRQSRILESSAASLGTGSPPPGMEQRPLEELPVEGDPLLLVGEDSP